MSAKSGRQAPATFFLFHDALPKRHDRSNGHDRSASFIGPVLTVIELAPSSVRLSSCEFAPCHSATFRRGLCRSDGCTLYWFPGCDARRKSQFREYPNLTEPSPLGIDAVAYELRSVLPRRLKQCALRLSTMSKSRSDDHYSLVIRK